MNGSPSPISIICSADFPASWTSVSKTASDMSALGCRWVSRGHIGQYRLHFAVVSTMYSTGSALNFGRRVTYPHRSLARFQARMVYLYCTCRAGRASPPAKLAEGASIYDSHDDRRVRPDRPASVEGIRDRGLRNTRSEPALGDQPARRR